MLATLVTAVINGLRGELVRVEIDVAPGLPVCHIVGLPDAALSEARERVRGAIRNRGFEYPMSRITVNLAPADRRKRGAAYDLAIAVGILVASGQIRRGGGSVGAARRAVAGGHGRAGAGRAADGRDARAAGLPARDRAAPRTRRRRGSSAASRPSAWMGSTTPRGSSPARAAARPARAARRSPVELSRPAAFARHAAARAGDGADRARCEPVDLADIRGQHQARWALEVALAGGHNLLLVGPPGAGKTLLARAIPGCCRRSTTRRRSR